MSKELVGYWTWFFKGAGGKRGIRGLFDLWWLVHLMVGVTLSSIVQSDLATSANSVLLPLSGILIGLSFAWAGNAQVLLQSKEMHELAEHHEGGFVEYIFVYQTAILMILITMITWGLAGLGIFDRLWPTEKKEWLFFFVKVILFSLSSLAVRECWHVIKGAQWMLLVQREMKRHSKAEGQSPNKVLK